jgi:predicted DCC family thiol-disulfide oxidoreductase YuxK
VNTLYVVREAAAGSEELLSKSEAVMTILDELKGFRTCVGLMKILPTALADFGYDLIAKNRYRIFGRYEACPLPRSDERERFIQT